MDDVDVEQRSWEWPVRQWIQDTKEQKRDESGKNVFFCWFYLSTRD